jgi:hypothetical protein
MVTERKPPERMDEPPLSVRIPRALRARFQQQMVAEGREHLSPFILDCAIDGLEDRIAKRELEAYRRSARNTGSAGA